MTAGQRRRLEITLLRLAEEARDLDGFLDRHAGADPDAAQVRRTLDRVRHDALRLAGELELDVEEAPVDWRRRVQAWASLWWSDVLDSGPGPLRGYGTVDPETAAFLGPRIEALASRLMEVRSHVAGE